MEYQVQFILGKPCLALDLGRAYVGFIHESENGKYHIDQISWKFFGKNIYNNEDAWNGLTLDYQISWPLNLVLSREIMETYSSIFRYLFPIKSVQLQLFKAWKTLQKLFRTSSLSEEDRYFMKQVL